ncbi:NADP-dependent oxidoreductase [Chelativorans sp. M5D2P16]|uniref:quinone oxidoreductase family protein n=1 Tax=Chelativorans sp. M5D2P16 TaxID=3095678 RepID=UPI002ACAAF98|nr:NADP-dependent oxidoreductase [Chelativorans sp. M5D2P16]MDZ5700208.1 NADP-dependent oxidoreductase [Chelativorans sp. M5D2P16]
MEKSIPDRMLAAAIDRFGGVEEFKVQSLRVPEIDRDEVLIRVEAVGVGVWDQWEREGVFFDLFRERHGFEPQFPYIIGFDGAGTVAAVGEAVQRFKVGDRVYADRHINPKGGFYAEYVAVKADFASHIPGNLTVEQAGAMPVDAITALLGLDDVLGLEKGETLMIFGAGGGLGHLAVQLAKRMGVRVFAVASGTDGVALARRSGADFAVDGRKEDVLAAARAFEPAGLDAALLTAGGEAAQHALQILRPGGRVAYPRGVSPTPEAQLNFTVEEYAGDEARREILDKLDHLITSNSFEVHVAQSFTLDQAADAHHALGEHYLGKLALRPTER